jgi:acetolactate synthase-1/2/3 large subunit
LASRPENAAAVHELIESGKLPVVRTFQAAGAISSKLFSSFAGRVGQIDNQPADEILAARDLIITIGYDPVEYWPSIWNKGNKRPNLHLDALPAYMDNSYSPTIELIGDIAATIRLLTPLASHSTPEPAIMRLLDRITEDRQELTRSSAALNGSPMRAI